MTRGLAWLGLLWAGAAGASITAPPATTWEPGAGGTLRVEVAGEPGPAQEDILLPEGWSLVFPPEVFDVDTAPAIRLVTVRVPANARAGDYEVAYKVRSPSGAVLSEAQIPVTVAAHAAWTTRVDRKAIALGPGDTATASVEVSNTGNVPLEVRGALGDAPQVRATLEATTWALEPGAVALIEVQLRAARSLPAALRQRVVLDLSVPDDPRRLTIPVDLVPRHLRPVYPDAVVARAGVRAASDLHTTSVDLVAGLSSPLWAHGRLTASVQQRVAGPAVQRGTPGEVRMVWSHGSVAWSNTALPRRAVQGPALPGGRASVTLGNRQLQLRAEHVAIPVAGRPMQTSVAVEAHPSSRSTLFANASVSWQDHLRAALTAGLDLRLMSQRLTLDVSTLADHGLSAPTWQLSVAGPVSGLLDWRLDTGRRADTLDATSQGQLWTTLEARQRWASGSALRVQLAHRGTDWETPAALGWQQLGMRVDGSVTAASGVRAALMAGWRTRLEPAAGEPQHTAQGSARVGWSGDHLQVAASAAGQVVMQGGDVASRGEFEASMRARPVSALTLHAAGTVRIATADDREELLETVVVRADAQVKAGPLTAWVGWTRTWGEEGGNELGARLEARWARDGLVRLGVTGTLPDVGEPQVRLRGEFVLPVRVGVGRVAGTGTVEGRLVRTTATGERGLAGVLVEVGAVRAVTGRDGTFRALFVPEGAAHVRVTGVLHEGEVLDLPTTALEVRTGETTTLPLRVLAGARVSGQVVVPADVRGGAKGDTLSGTGKVMAPGPVAGIVVELLRDGDRRVALTDADGRYDLSGLIPGTWTLRFSGPRLPDLHVVNQPSEALELTAGADVVEDRAVQPVTRQIQILETADVLE